MGQLVDLRRQEKVHVAEFVPEVALCQRRLVGRGESSGETIRDRNVDWYEGTRELRERFGVPDALKAAPTI